MIIKKIDSVGRIVIPMEIRNVLNWNSGDEIELINQDNELILKKHYPKLKVCCLCGRKNELIELKNDCICKECISSLLK